INTQQNNQPNNGFQQQIFLTPGMVLFDSIASNGEGISLIDVPLVDNNTGYQLPIGNLYVPGNNVPEYGTVSVVNPNNTINYITGAFTITFGGNAPVAPA